MYIPEFDLTTNDASAVVSATVLQEQLMNNFTFDSCPQVVAYWRRPHFRVYLVLGPIRVGPLLLTAAQVRRALRNIRRRRQTSLIRLVQPLVVELERAREPWQQVYRAEAGFADSGAALTFGGLHGR